MRAGTCARARWGHWRLNPVVVSIKETVLLNNDLLRSFFKAIVPDMSHAKLVFVIIIDDGEP